MSCAKLFEKLRSRKIEKQFLLPKFGDFEKTFATNSALKNPILLRNLLKNLILTNRISILWSLYHIKKQMNCECCANTLIPRAPPMTKCPFRIKNLRWPVTLVTVIFALVRRRSRRPHHFMALPPGTAATYHESGAGYPNLKHCSQRLAPSTRPHHTLCDRRFGGGKRLHGSLAPTCWSAACIGREDRDTATSQVPRRGQSCLDNRGKPCVGDDIVTCADGIVVR